MVGFNYDDSASRYLGITLLSLYCIPAVIHIVRTIVKWKPEHKDLPAVRAADGVYTALAPHCSPLSRATAGTECG